MSLRATSCALLLTVLAGGMPAHAYKMLRPNPATGSDIISAYQVQCDDNAGFAHRTVNSISWYHNLGGQGSDKAAAIQAALATWTNATQANYVLTYAGTTSAGLNNSDNQNTLVWGDTDPTTLCGKDRCHAVTVLRVTSGSGVTGSVIQEADIVLNQNMSWGSGWTGTCTSTTPGTVLDTQAIVTHELGHSLGIHHPLQTESTFASATMGGSSCNVDGRSLSSDDLEALQCLTNRYPVSPTYDGYLENATCQTISGWTWNSGFPNDPTYVELRNGTSVIKVVPANLCRSDLAAAGKGNGCHAFTLPTPSQYKNGGWATVSVRHTGTGLDINWSPKQIACGVELLPDQPGSSDYLSTGGSPYEVATQFSSSVSGNITALGYYFQYGETGAHTIRLWSDTGTLLASTTISPSPFFSGIGWSYGLLSTPYPITANTRYRVSITTFDVQTKTPCSSTNPKSLYNWITNGPLTAYQGFWSAGNGVFPTTSSCSNFWVSVKFDS
jgi:hypothetical protein